MQWTKAAVLAFLKIKHKLIHFTYNYIIDPEAPLVIYADSSLTAIGAALTQEIDGVLLPVGFMSKSLNPTQTRYPIFDKELYSCFMAVKHFSAEISGRQVTMYNDHYALVQQYNRPEPLQSNIASEQRRMRMMGELSYRGVKLVHTPGRENPLADFLSRMNQDKNCSIFQKMQHQQQETWPAGTSRTEHSQAFMNNRAQRQDAAVANRSVNFATSVTDRQPDDEGVCSVNSNGTNTATALAQCDFTHCNAPLVKAAANTPVVSVVSAIELFLLFLLLNTTGYNTSALCRIQYFAVMSNTF